MRNLFFLFLVTVIGMFALRGWATPIITSVVETGGDNEATDTIAAQYTGKSFVNGVANEPLPNTPADASFLVGTFNRFAPTFVDRNHRYDVAQTDPLVPIPAYLVGGEYIMSGNDNRDNTPYQLDVTVNRAVVVYMLIDNRLQDGDGNTPPTFGPANMQWIVDQAWTPVQTGINRFGNSGIPDEVGIDEGADGSINQWYSIYSKRFPAGTFSLLQAENAGRNMYGVVIQPAPKPQLSIGLNFGADEPSGAGSALAATAVAGAIPQANWNNLIGASGSGSALVADAAGTATPTTTTVEWASPNTWSSTGRGEENSGFAAGTPDRALMTGYVDTGDSAATVATVTVSGIPAEFTSGGYDILVYCLGGVAGRGGAYTIGGVTKYGTSPANPAAHVEDAGAGLTDTGTYVRFRGQYGASFTLVASAAPDPGSNFRAPVNGIQIVRNSDPNAGLVRGYLTKFRYDNIGGSVNVIDLINNPKYINNQFDVRCLRTDFSANDVNECNDCGFVVRGFFIPTATGNHTFYISADDGAALYLSTDDSAANKVEIAREPVWAGRKNYIGDADGGGRGDPPVNRSAPITLIAGQKYYIEGAVKEGGGGDNLDVAVEGPGDAPVEDGQLGISGNRIATQVDLTGSSLVITQNPANQQVPEGNTASFTVAATATSPLCGAVALYQWQRNGVNIPGANAATYTIAVATPDDHLATFRCVVTFLGIQRVSTAATLEVLGRECLKVLSAAASGFNTISVTFSTFINTNDGAGATDPFNYTVEGADGSFPQPATVAVAPGNKSVIISINEALAENVVYTVSVGGVMSQVGSDLCAAPDDRASFTSWVSGGVGNGVVFEVYNVNNRLGIDDLLTNQVNFPNNPRQRFLISAFDSRLAPGYEGDGNEDYAGRLTGLFIPPVSGNWRFHMRSDDPGRLYINPTGPSAAGKVQVGDQPGCCNGFPASGGQLSVPFALVAGQAYYVELLYREFGGGDYGQVAVSLDGGPGPTSANLAGFLVGAGASPAGIGGALTITQQPASQSVFANAFVTFSVGASSANGLQIAYQWTRNGVDIPGANSASYTFGPVTVDDNGAVYAVKAGVVGTTAVSDNANLEVLADTVKPTVVSIRGKTDLTKLVVLFSELVDETSAEDSFNYAIVGGVPGVNGALLGADGMTVTLSLDAALTPDTTYQVSVSGVEDLAVNTMDPATVSVLSFANRRGFLLKELYQNIPGVAVADLLSNPAYPDSPSIVRYGGLAELNTFDEFENYGARMSGWVIAPVSGNYHFYMSSDDGGAMFLSTDASPANLRQIAAEPVWNGRRDWLGTARRNAAAPENRSATLFPDGIALTAGQSYYFEALVKEGGGGDNLAFTWQLPGEGEPASGTAALSGVYMSSLVDPTGAGIQITQQPTDQTNVIIPGSPTAGSTFTVAVSATGPNAANVFYQWSRDNGSGWNVVKGANSASFTIAPTLADNGAKFRCEVFVPGAEATSDTATLTVAQRNTAPRFTAGGDQNVNEDAGAQSVQWATGISPHSIVRTPVAYSNDFSAGLAGMEAFGIAAVADGALKLTTPINSSYGAASISTPAVQTYESLSVRWKSRVGGGAGGGADGYSLNIGEDVPADPGYGGEEGIGTGLTVTVDTFDNGTGEDVGVDIKWRGARVAYVNIPKDDDGSGSGNFIRKDTFVNASLDLTAAGVATVTYDGNTISATLANFAGLRANRALFWARTGGANDNQWVDDFGFVGFLPDASSAEAGQTVHFNVSNSNPSLFSVQPAIDGSGRLTYTPAPNANGSAVVTVVAQDDGGTAHGGADSSAPVTFNINVAPVNDCPTVAGQALTVDAGGSVNFQLSGSDVDGDALTYSAGAAAHGTVVVSPSGAGTYTPAAGYSGPDSFSVSVSDGTCPGNATVTVTVRESNRCPTAVAKVEPNVQLEPGQTETVVIAGNNTNACVILDGTASSDPDDDALNYSWVVVQSDGSTIPLASGATATACLDVGSYRIRLIVDDGRCDNSADVEVEIITASEAVDVLIDKVNNSNYGRNKRPLIASLKAAGASFDRGSCHSATGQLGAFINKCRAQVAKQNPVLAADLIRCANAILDSVDCP